MTAGAWCYDGRVISDLTGRAALALLLALPSACAPALPPSIGHPLAGRPAPRFEREAADGRVVGVPAPSLPGSPSTWKRSSVTVVDFWASWCSGCVQSMGSLQALYESKRDRGLEIIAVNTDEQREAAMDIVRRVGIAFPVVLDPGQDLAASYVAARIPISFVVDRAGTIRWVGRDMTGLRTAVDAILAE